MKTMIKYLMVFMCSPAMAMQTSALNHNGIEIAEDILQSFAGAYDATQMEIGKPLGPVKVMPNKGVIAEDILQSFAGAYDAMQMELGKSPGDPTIMPKPIESAARAAVSNDIRAHVNDMNDTLTVLKEKIINRARFFVSSEKIFQRSALHSWQIGRWEQAYKAYAVKAIKEGTPVEKVLSRVPENDRSMDRIIYQWLMFAEDEEGHSERMTRDWQDIGRMIWEGKLVLIARKDAATQTE